MLIFDDTYRVTSAKAAIEAAIEAQRRARSETMARLLSVSPRAHHARALSTISEDTVVSARERAASSKGKADSGAVSSPAVAASSAELYVTPPIALPFDSQITAAVPAAPAAVTGDQAVDEGTIANEKVDEGRDDDEGEEDEEEISAEEEPLVRTSRAASAAPAGDGVAE